MPNPYQPCRDFVVTMLIAACWSSTGLAVDWPLDWSRDQGEYGEWLELETDDFLGEQPYLHGVLEQPAATSWGVTYGSASVRSGPINGSFEHVFGLLFEYSRRRFDGSEAVIRYQLTIQDDYDLATSESSLMSNHIDAGLRRLVPVGFIPHLLLDTEIGMGTMWENGDYEGASAIINGVRFAYDEQLIYEFRGVRPYVGFQFTRPWPAAGVTLSASLLGRFRAGTGEILRQREQTRTLDDYTLGVEGAASLGVHYSPAGGFGLHAGYRANRFAILDGDLSGWSGEYFLSFLYKPKI